MKISRRDFIAGGLVASGMAGFASYSGLFSQKAIAGEIQGASSAIGHQLREGKFPQPVRTLKKEVVIVGGGISGLSACYTMA